MGGLSEQQTPADELSVIHSDAHLLVLDKPSGLLCVPGRGADKQDCLAARAQRLYPDALVVHRLDMATSGLFLMARGAAMQRALSLAFANRQVGKRYAAVAAGRLAPPPGMADEWALIDLPIAADWPRRPLRIIDHERGKPSQTRWRVAHLLLPSPRGHHPSNESRDTLLAPGHGHKDFLPPPPREAWGGAYTRLELEPVTGRSHQLRVHLQALGHPILGDALYAPAEVHACASRLLLHATELRLTHPASGQPLCFASPAPF